tara:strand:- start:893 stop:1015 length:123 start_codon:yes stop_codon:yes gene_type:complete
MVYFKLFLGCTFIALGMALIILLRSTNIGTDRFAKLPKDK